ncbi:MAG: hypothetical protein ACE5FC_00340 [Myxococcota bacterium]
MRTVNRLGAILGALLALSTGISGSGRAAPAGLGERLTDPASGYTLRGPAGWEARRGALEGVSLVFLGPAEGGFAANLSVVVVPEVITPTPRLVEQLARNLEAKMRGRKPAEGGAPDFRVTRRRVAPVAGADAAYLESAFTRERPGGPAAFRQLQVIVPGPGEHYVLTYTARAEAFDAWLPVIRAAVNSFTPGLGPARAEPPTPWHGRRATRVLVGLMGVILLGLALRQRRRGSRA